MVTKKVKTQIVLVRTYSAGVHFGELVKREGKEIELRNARRIWRWFGANTLNEIAASGLDVARSKVSEVSENLVLTEAIEVHSVSAKAQEVLSKGVWGNG